MIQNKNIRGFRDNDLGMSNQKAQTFWTAANELDYRQRNYKDLAANDINIEYFMKARQGLLEIRHMQGMGLQKSL